MNDAPVKWRRLTGLSAWQWEVLLASPLILLLTWVRLRSEGYRRTLARVQAASQSRHSPQGEMALALKTAYALAVAVKYGPWWPGCLVRSLALGWFLGRQGIPFEVRFGVPENRAAMSAQGQRDLMAHAWVEHAGVVLNDKEDVAADYRPFERGSGFSREIKEDRDDLNDRDDRG